ncbi:MAG: hypothetical protein CVV13_10250 [Gammaproteobacteria bacterium HGW-Gammaproteobacteria-3]|nr:MAG: hypothetical protein CVV13_10250 [Gammaproteobacteria bacterium HGW-Gammaproteobacteria-3]
MFSLKPESVFKLNQNRCSDWIRIGVQVEPEYARIAPKWFVIYFSLNRREIDTLFFYRMVFIQY